MNNCRARALAYQEQIQKDWWISEWGAKNHDQSYYMFLLYTAQQHFKYLMASAQHEPKQGGTKGMKLYTQNARNRACDFIAAAFSCCSIQLKDQQAGGFTNDENNIDQSPQLIGEHIRKLMAKPENPYNSPNHDFPPVLRFKNAHVFDVIKTDEEQERILKAAEDADAIFTNRHTSEARALPRVLENSMIHCFPHPSSQAITRTLWVITDSFFCFSVVTRK